MAQIKSWTVSDKLWAKVEPLVPVKQRQPGRRRDAEQILWRECGMAAPAGAGGVSVPAECAAAQRDAAGFGEQAKAGLRGCGWALW